MLGCGKMLTARCKRRDPSPFTSPAPWPGLAQCIVLLNIAIVVHVDHIFPGLLGLQKARHAER